MAATIALRRQGIAVDLVEIDPEWRCYGAGISLGGATLRARCRISVSSTTSCSTASPPTAPSYARPTAPSSPPCPRPASPAPAYPATAPSCARVLARIMERATRAVGGVDIRLGCSFSAIRQGADGVEADFTDGQTRRYDLVVGADGLYSKVREAVMPDAPRPRYSGQAVWRAVLPRPAEITCTRLWAGPKTKVGVNPVSEGEMYLFINEVRATTTTSSRPVSLVVSKICSPPFLTSWFSRCASRSVNTRPLSTVPLKACWCPLPGTAAGLY